MGNKESTNSKAGAGDRSNNKVKKGKKEVQDKIDRERYGVGVAYGSGGNMRWGDRVNKLEMFGGKASKYTNQYLESIGEAKKGNPYYDHKGNITGYSYLLTSKGNQMKYGKSNSAMGSGDKSGIMTSIPISQRMHDSQMKTQALMVGGLSLLAGPIGGTIMRASAADSFNKIGSKGYQKYQKSFKANMNRDMSSFVQNNTSRANKAMGSVGYEKETQSTKFTKNIGRSFTDPKAKKRSLFKTV